MPAPKRLTDKIKPWVIKAINNHSENESIIWETSVMTFPDPSVWDTTSGQPANLPALVVYLEMPTDNPLVSIYAAKILPPFTVTAESIDQAVEETLTSMRVTRTTRQDEILTSDES